MICPYCDGSGEGSHDGSRCLRCRGRGEILGYVVAECGCGARYDEEGWQDLDEGGQQDDGDGGEIELRRCCCGSTISRGA